MKFHEGISGSRGRHGKEYIAPWTAVETSTVLHGTRSFARQQFLHDAGRPDRTTSKRCSTSPAEFDLSYVLAGTVFLFKINELIKATTRPIGSTSM
jgi:hypothetical protein